MENIYFRIFIILSFTTISTVSYSQSLFGDDHKREMLKSIKPAEKPSLSPSSPKFQSKTESIINNKYTRSYSNLRNGIDYNHLMEITEPKYKLSPNLTKYNGAIPLNVTPAGATQWVYMGGHFHIISIAGKPIFPSGISLGGGGTKKLSTKSKNILINVFGMEVDE